MKKILIPILGALAVFTACNEDLLEIPQKGVISTTNFYQTEEDAEAARVAVYQGLVWNVCAHNGVWNYNPNRFVWNLCADDMYAAGEFFGDNDYAAAMNEFRYDTNSEVITHAYQNYYYAMYYPNLVIHYFKDGLPNGKGHTDITRRAVAEAKVIRAYLHMMLAIGWGTPPKVDALLDPAAMPKNSSSQADLLAWCAKECIDALPDLDERESTGDKAGAAKATKGFANAVIGKCYLFMKDWTNAKKYLGDVIKSGKYALVSGENYWQNFHDEGDGNEEKIFEANIDRAEALNAFSFFQKSSFQEANIWMWRTDHFVANPAAVYNGNMSNGGWGGLGIPQHFVDKFIANDGLESHRLKGTMVSIEDVVYNFEYVNADINAMTLEQKKASHDIGLDNRGLYGQSFYLDVKQAARKNDLYDYGGTQIRMNNFVIMRYAEVLLMYAEACLELGDEPEARKYINMIQERAGSKTVSSKVDMNILKTEKQLELWLEGNRWPDMVRWGDFDRAKDAGKDVTVLYDKFTREPKADDKDVTYFYEGSRFYTVKVNPAAEHGYDFGFKEGKHELFPFPFAVASKNANLVQNPNW